MATKGNLIEAAVISVSVEALPFGNITITQQPSSPLLLGLLSCLNQKPRLVSKDGSVDHRDLLFPVSVELLLSDDGIIAQPSCPLWLCWGWLLSAATWPKRNHGTSQQRSLCKWRHCHWELALLLSPQAPAIGGWLLSPVSVRNPDW